jgi:hypothetical protein
MVDADAVTVYVVGLSPFIRRSLLERQLRLMKVLLLALVSWPLLCGVGACADQERSRMCFSAQEAREKVLTHRLSEPFRVMRTAATQAQAEAIAAKLCRWKEEFVYEISLLRHDGHVLRVFVNASDGHTAVSRNPK